MDAHTLNCTGLVCMSVDIKNTGFLPGAEVAQLYLGFPESAAEPLKVLRGFHKVYIQPGSTSSVEFALSQRDLEVFDVSLWSWRRPEGVFKLYVGSLSRDIRI